jgi:hypothetical protein
MPENFGQSGKVFLSSSKKFLNVSNCSGCCLSHERENNIISSWEQEGGILTFENQGVELTSLFHPNLIPNLGKMKIFILWVKISQHNYPPRNPNAMSFAKSVFTPLV